MTTLAQLSSTPFPATPGCHLGPLGCPRCGPGAAVLRMLCQQSLESGRVLQGWFLPAEAAMQFQQCVVQQVRPEVLVPAAEDKKKKKAAVGEAAASLLQLPGVDGDAVRNLDKNARIRSLQVGLPPALRALRDVKLMSFELMDGWWCHHMQRQTLRACGICSCTPARFGCW